MAEFLDAGGRWFALHATNAILEFVDGGKADTPDLAPNFMKLLGSRFVAHPANQKFTVRVSDIQHPLTAGISDFEVEDEEPYYCEKLGEQLVLLEASYNERSSKYVQSDYGTRSRQPPTDVSAPLG